MDIVLIIEIISLGQSQTIVQQRPVNGENITNVSHFAVQTASSGGAKGGEGGSRSGRIPFTGAAISLASVFQLH